MNKGLVERPLRARSLVRKKKPKHCSYWLCQRETLLWLKPAESATVTRETLSADPADQPIQRTGPK